MFLDKVNSESAVADDIAAQPPAAGHPAPHDKWKHFPHSGIAHHGGACCETAREWFLAMDGAMLFGESPLTGPRWIRARYDWGPASHPVHWCEIVKRKTQDCGAHAALALACFRERGVSAFPAQFVQRYSAAAAGHWHSRWIDEDVSTHWINGDEIYHEGCAVLAAGNDIRLWDASAGWWLNPSQTRGYGSLASVRIHTGPAGANTSFLWGAHHLPADEWISL